MTTIGGAPPIRWRAALPESLVWADYGPDFALFHRPSCQTHFVNAATALLLQDILIQPMDAAGASQALADAAQDPGSPAELLDYVTAILHRLEELGLVDRVP